MRLDTANPDDMIAIGELTGDLPLARHVEDAGHVLRGERVLAGLQVAQLAPHLAREVPVDFLGVGRAEVEMLQLGGGGPERLGDRVERLAGRDLVPTTETM